ncbi:MAG: hypothetical protein ABSC37_05815 [Xanthobacteraceae bacterium]
MKIKLPQRIGLVRLSLLALVVGLVAGFGAVVHGRHPKPWT